MVVSNTVGTNYEPPRLQTYGKLNGFTKGTLGVSGDTTSNFKPG